MDKILLNKAKNGDLLARNAIIMECLPLIKAVARKYSSLTVSFEDFVQEGVFAIINAINNFDVNRGIEFNIYATYFLRKRMNNVVAYNTPNIIRGTKYLVLKKKIINYQSKYYSLNGRYPTNREIALSFNISEDIISSMLNDEEAVISYNTTFIEDIMLLDTIKSANNTEEETINSVILEEIINIINSLPPHKQEIVKKYYFEGLSDEEISRIFGLSRQRINVIRNNTLKLVRKKLKLDAKGVAKG